VSKCVNRQYGELKNFDFVEGIEFSDDGAFLYTAISNHYSKGRWMIQLKGDYRAEGNIIYISNAMNNYTVFTDLQYKEEPSYDFRPSGDYKLSYEYEAETDSIKFASIERGEVIFPVTTFWWRHLI